MRIFTSFIPSTIKYNISENMAENQRKKMKNENIESTEETLSSTTLEDACAVFIKEEDVKVEISEPYQGKIIKYNLNINIKIPCIKNCPTKTLDTLKVVFRYLNFFKNT